MERFRLRMRQQAKRGQIIELHLFPNMPGRNPREADEQLRRVLHACSVSLDNRVAAACPPRGNRLLQRISYFGCSVMRR